MFAGGARAIERWLEPRGRWLRVAVTAVLVLGSLPIVPLSTWMLSPEQYLAYRKALGIRFSKVETYHEGPLPQPIGDQFGWPEMVRQVAAIYNSLPPAERARTGIFTGNYGEARVSASVCDHLGTGVVCERSAAGAGPAELPDEPPRY